jgi:hypothetical protein
VGAKSGQTQKSAGRQRLWLALFGALLVALFLVFAVTQGIGQPNVPEGDVAVIEDVPDEISNISEEELDRSLAQQVANAISEGQLKKAPKAGSTREEELREAAMTELIERVWLRGEAEELGITVTAKQVENELEQIKEQNFPTPKAYKEFLESSKYTQEDVDQLVELQVLSNQIQARPNRCSPRTLKSLTTTRPPRRASSRPNRAATSASSPTKARPRSKKRSRLWKPTARPRAGTRSRRSTPKTPRRTAKAGCRKVCRKKSCRNR